MHENAAVVEELTGLHVSASRHTRAGQAFDFLRVLLLLVLAIILLLLLSFCFRNDDIGISAEGCE